VAKTLYCRDSFFSPAGPHCGIEKNPISGYRHPGIVTTGIQIATTLAEAPIVYSPTPPPPPPAASCIHIFIWYQGATTDESVRELTCQLPAPRLKHIYTLEGLILIPVVPPICVLGGRFLFPKDRMSVHFFILDYHSFNPDCLLSLPIYHLTFSLFHILPSCFLTCLDFFGIIGPSSLCSLVFNFSILSPALGGARDSVIVSELDSRIFTRLVTFALERW